MPIQLWTNNATTLLDADILIGATSLTVTSTEGALFPNPTAGDWFYATIQSGSLIEIIQVTSRTGDTFDTIVRGQDGTSAIAWTAGATIELRVTKAWLDRVLTLDTNPNAGDVTGPAGGVVDNEVVFYDGTTGKLVKGSGLLLSGSNTGDQVLPPYPLRPRPDHRPVSPERPRRPVPDRRGAGHVRKGRPALHEAGRRE